METYSGSFEGGLLTRGFWIYAWKITAKDSETYFYVGRTGDSSSANAGSPLSRMAAHFDHRKTAKGNSLHKAMQVHHILREQCTFDLWACGPIFKEEKEWPVHKKSRDIIAAFEYRLSHDLKQAGLEVLGTHGSKHLVMPDMQARYDEVLRGLKKHFRIPDTTM